MAKHTQVVLGRAVAHYEALIGNVQRLNTGATFYPYQGYDVFIPNHADSTDEVALFDIPPVIVNIPLRGHLTTNDLFVVFEGRIGLDVEAARDERLVTKKFASRVGYFARTKDVLEHVYGMHCDLDTEHLAHPAFHAQMKSFGQKFLPHVQEWVNVPMEHDRMLGVLQNVRLPTAQLDFFALIVQLAADHLMWEDSGDAERQGFNDLLTLDRQVRGVTPDIQWLVNGAVIPCHRAGHWYALAPVVCTP